MEIKVKKSSVVEGNITLRTKPCCEKMAEALTKDFIIVLEDGEKNVYPIILKATVTNKSPREAVCGSMRIKFCPFCGEEIKAKVI